MGCTVDFMVFWTVLKINQELKIKDYTGLFEKLEQKIQADGDAKAQKIIADGEKECQRIIKDSGPRMKIYLRRLKK